MERATWMTAASWTDTSEPRETELTSPRTTALYQMDERSPTVTSPTTDAEGATKAVEGIVGTLPECGTTVRWVGTEKKKTS